MTNIWRRGQPDFKKVLSYPSADISYGFKVESNPVSDISWNITYSQLLAMNIGQVISGVTDNKIYQFAYPVIIGRIKFNHLKITWDLKTLDFPVKHYFIDIDDSRAAIDSFSQLRLLFTEDDSYSESSAYITSVDSPLYSITTKDILFKLTRCASTKSTRLEIINQHHYAHPILLANHYCNYGAVSHLYHLGQDLEVACELGYYDYCVKSVPSFVTSACTQDEDNIVWIDEINQIVGFKGSHHCLIIPNKIEKIRIDNLRPAKGIGGSWLYLSIEGFKEEICPYVYQYPFTYNRYAEGLADFLGIDIEVNDLGGDC
ncbi:MAG: hypothetical protein Q4P13_05035 [Psychrobacter sp.]|nr:hypothetical protein [Psychrobacter sp.]